MAGDVCACCSFFFEGGLLDMRKGWVPSIPEVMHAVFVQSPNCFRALWFRV